MSGLRNKIKDQEFYIKNNLKNIESCMILDKQKHDINSISTHIVKDILNNKFESGPDMNAVVCMFDNLFLSTSQSKKDGLFRLSVHVSQWVKKMEKIDISSTSGYVYFTDILSDIQVIIKLPKDIGDYNDMVKEYFIGVTAINKMRYILPNFIYTFGAFICPFDNKKLCKESNTNKDDEYIPFVVFEKIPGDNMQKMLENGKLTFTQYLGMFIQVLLALEVAQRTISFTHFDFHTANLMCRTIKEDCKYNVSLDNNLYEITATDYLPVIIDFGLSTVKNEDNIIGSYTFPEHGMKHYMIPGVDMFKFLYYSVSFSQGNIQRQILDLFSFYGNDDPYKVLVSGDKAIEKSINEYVKKGSYSRVTTYTPLEFLTWILENPEYSDITSKYMKKRDRNIYVPLSFSTTVQIYDDIFEHSKHGREQAIKLVEEYSTSYNSYILSKYSIYVLSGYNSKLKSKELRNDIKRMKNTISKSRVEMIKNDYKILWEYKKLSIPDIIKIKDDSKRILTIKINSKKLKSDNTPVLKLIERYYSNTSFFIDILHYLQFMYTIKEIKSEKMYSKFLKSFLVSPQYKMYTQNYEFINKTSRWCQTLLDSMV
jgi:hypothetical protein